MAEMGRFKVGDRVQQINKNRRGGLKITRIMPNGRWAICVPVMWNGKMFNIRVDQLRRMT